MEGEHKTHLSSHPPAFRLIVKLVIAVLLAMEGKQRVKVAPLKKIWAGADAGSTKQGTVCAALVASLHAFTAHIKPP